MKQILCKLNYKYYLYVLYKKDANYYSKSKLVNKKLLEI